MSRIVIDTNILYSIIGISENKKVKNSRIHEHKLSITTASLIEAIVKFRSCLLSIKKCLEPVICKQLELISIGHAPLSNEVIFRLWEADDIKDVASDISLITDLKISREAEFFRFLLIVVASGIFEILKSDSYGFTDTHKKAQQNLLVHALLESNMDLALDFFKTKIKEGYDSESEQKTALEAFNQMLLMLMNIFRFNYHQIKTEFILCPTDDSVITLKKPWKKA